MAAGALVPDGEAAVTEQPGDRALDLTAVTAEALGGVDAGAGDPRHDAPFPQPPEVVGLVMGLIGAELGRAPTARAAPGPHRGNAQDERLERLAVVHVRGGDADRQRQAPGVGQHVELTARLATVDRVWAGQRAPLFARTEAASMMAEVQSTSPRAPSSSRTARCRRRHRPAFVQAANLRCAIAGDTRTTAQMPPGAPARQHVHHGREHRTIIQRS